jgi:hypothetical protein
MKVTLVRDPNGKVVATFEHPSAPGGPSVRPVLRPGHTLHDVEADEGYRKNLPEFYKRHSRE